MDVDSSVAAGWEGLWLIEVASCAAEVDLVCVAEYCYVVDVGVCACVGTNLLV